MVVAYYGSPQGIVWGRVKFSSMEYARVECFNNSSLWGLHDTVSEITWADELWEKTKASEEKERCGKECEQLSLF